MSTVIGVDPGPMPGIVRLSIEGGRIEAVDVVQCTAPLLYPTLRDVLGGLTADVIQCERFVARGRASSAQTVTRDQVGNLLALFPARVVLVNASQMKAWATDQRLQAAVCRDLDTTLWQITAGMRHARDAARHALYTAVKSQLLRDPLSKAVR